MTQDRSQDSVRVELIQHRATLGDKGAFVVSPVDAPERDVFLPKSQIIAIEYVAPFGAALSINAYTMPRWLALDRGLLGERDGATGDLFGGENG